MSPISYPMIAAIFQQILLYLFPSFPHHRNLPNLESSAPQLHHWEQAVVPQTGCSLKRNCCLGLVSVTSHLDISEFRISWAQILAVSLALSYFLQLLPSWDPSTSTLAILVGRLSCVSPLLVLRLCPISEFEVGSVITGATQHRLWGPINQIWIPFTDLYDSTIWPKELWEPIIHSLSFLIKQRVPVISKPAQSVLFPTTESSRTQFPELGKPFRILSSLRELTHVPRLDFLKPPLRL